MKRAVLVVLLVLSACSDSAAPPVRVDAEEGPRYVKTVARGGAVVKTSDQGIALRGRISAGPGAPASGIPAQIEKVSSGFGPITCFFGCRFPPRCSEGDASRSNERGRFVLKMCKPAGRDLVLTLGETYTNRPWIRLPLFLRTDRMLLPRLRFWDAKTSFDGRNRLMWSALPQQGFGQLTSYRIDAREPGEEFDPMWLSLDAAPGETIDPRVFEDTSGEIYVTALTRVLVDGGCGGKCRHELSFTSGGIPFESAGAPFSRGKTCFIRNPQGPSSPGCYLNDGDSFRDLYDYSCSEQLNCKYEDGWAGVDLGETVELDLIVARGCDFCRVSISANGREWRSVEETQSDDSLRQVSLWDLGSGVRARYVRVKDAGDILELSVWRR